MAEDKEVKKKEKELEAREKALQEKEAHFEEVQAFLDHKEAELEAREKALAQRGPSVAPASEEKKPLSKAEQKLIEEGCEAYGIPAEHLFASGIDPRTKEAILVTNGGKKVRYSKDMKVEPLDPVAVDGVPRKKPRYLMGKKKEK